MRVRWSCTGPCVCVTFLVEWSDGDLLSCVPPLTVFIVITYQCAATVECVLVEDLAGSQNALLCRRTSQDSPEEGSPHMEGCSMLLQRGDCRWDDGGMTLG